jgi:hypothetical protein
LEVRFALCLAVVAFATTVTWAQKAVGRTIPTCGEVKVTLGHPEYLTTIAGIVIAEAPPRWALDKARQNPFFFFKHGENYDNARTLMYIRVERLDVPLQRAVENDQRSFQERGNNCEVRDLARAPLLERGCESRTQLFLCNGGRKPYVDLVTKISIKGLLLNVVLSADTISEISKYRDDYNFLLQHLTLVN